MKNGLIVLSLLMLCSLPLQAVGQSHQGHGGHGSHGAVPPAGAPPSGHDSMKHGDAIMLEEVTEAGVKAMVHLMDVGAMMAKMGKQENYHFMITFTDTASGAGVSTGAVALKVTAPGQNAAGKPLALMAMDGQFGADISLPEKGTYTFEVGTKLADGLKRSFQFKYTVK